MSFGGVGECDTRNTELTWFSDFLRPTSFETLLQAANEGPVIIINHFKYISDCLIVLKDSEPIRIPLMEPFFVEALEQLSHLYVARELLRSSPAEYNNALRSTMEWLWKNAI